MATGDYWICDYVVDVDDMAYRLCPAATPKPRAELLVDAAHVPQRVKEQADVGGHGLYFNLSDDELKGRKADFRAWMERNL